MSTMNTNTNHFICRARVGVHISKLMARGDKTFCLLCDFMYIFPVWCAVERLMIQTVEINQLHTVVMEQHNIIVMNTIFTRY